MRLSLGPLGPARTGSIGAFIVTGVIDSIVNQHAEEASALWWHHRNATTALCYGMRRITKAARSHRRNISTVYELPATQAFRRASATLVTKTLGACSLQLCSR